MSGLLVVAVAYIAVDILVLSERGEPSTLRASAPEPAPERGGETDAGSFED